MEEKNKIKGSILKKMFPWIIFIIAVLIIMILMIKSAVNKNAATDYKGTLQSVVTTMLAGGSEAEDVGGLIRDVWYNTIYEKEDYITNKYTKKNGYNIAGKGFNDDFNDSLKKLFADSNYSDKIWFIKENQELVKEGMKLLKNPSKEYKEAYSALKDMYDSYLEFTNLVISPSGSLQSYTNKFNDAVSNMIKNYEAVELYID